MLHFTVWDEDYEGIEYSGEDIRKAGLVIVETYSSLVIADIPLERMTPLWALDFRERVPHRDPGECWEDRTCPYYKEESETEAEYDDRTSRSFFRIAADAWFCAMYYSDEVWDDVKELLDDELEDTTKEEALLIYLEGFDTVEISTLTT